MSGVAGHDKYFCYKVKTLYLQCTSADLDDKVFHHRRRWIAVVVQLFRP